MLSEKIREKVLIQLPELPALDEDVSRAFVLRVAMWLSLI
jgi:hypothetical protein